MKSKREYRYEGDILYIKCNTCGKWCGIDGYFRDKCKQFGVRYSCKECDYKKKKQYYIDNKDKFREIHKRYYQEHRDLISLNKKQYRSLNKEKMAELDKKYRETNREKLKKVIESHTQELGFNWITFHSKANTYIKKHSLRPDKCPLCGNCGSVEVHHPSYKTFEKRSEVVFCCSSCHKKIHSGILECPNPIDLLQLKPI